MTMVLAGVTQHTAWKMHFILSCAATECSCHLGHQHRSNYPNDRLEEAKEPGAQVPFREGLPEIEKKETPKILQPRKVEKHSFKKREKG